MSIEDLAKSGSELIKALRVRGEEEAFRRLLSDLYPDKAHFIYELFQNAEDAGASLCSFTLTKDDLTFEHNGPLLFSEENVKAITSFGNSTKRDDPTQIGKFGVGFKAVFAYTNTPEIESGEYFFRINDLIVPEILERAGTIRAQGLTRFRFPFNHPLKKPKEAYDEIESALKALSESTLLFLENISTINYQLPNGESGSVKRIDHANERVEIEVSHSKVKNSNTNWKRYTQRVKVSDDRGEIKDCRIAIAFSMESEKKNGKVSWKIVPVKFGEVAIYFPAEGEHSNLKFHIHAPFSSTVARDKIKHSSGNNALRDHIAALTVDSLFRIRDQGLLTIDFFSVLPNPSDSLKEFYEPIRIALVKAFQEHPLTPTKMGDHAPASSLYRGPAAISNLLSDHDISFFTGYETPLWVANPPQNNQREDRFLESLEVDDWSWRELGNHLRRDEKEARDALRDWILTKGDTWLVRFYALLDELLNDHHEYIWNVQSLPIARVETPEGENHISLNHAFFHPERSTFYVEGISFIKQSLFPQKPTKTSERARAFLRENGVSPYDKRSIVSLKLTGYKGTPCEITKEHIDDLFFIFSHWEENPDDLAFFKGHKFVLGKNPQGGYGWHNPSRLYLDSPFEENGLARHAEELGITVLAQEYKDQLDKKTLKVLLKFLKALGIRNCLEIAQVSITDNPNKQYLLTAPGGRAGDLINKDFQIKGINHLLLNISPSVSSLIWKTMCSTDNIDCKLKAIYQRTKAGGSREADSQLVHTLRNSAWVQQDEDQFVRPSEAEAEKLPEGFTYNSKWKWVSALNFGLDALRKTEDHKNKESLAKEIGFESLEHAQEIALLLKNKEVTTNQIREFASNMNRIEQPESSVFNPDRRRQKVLDHFESSPLKETSKRLRSVMQGIDRENNDAKIYLKNLYTNRNGQLVCQCCQKEMPFKVKEEYYFEAVLCMRDLQKYQSSNRLALCPNCAAMYQYARETDDNKLRSLILEKDALNTDVSISISVSLAGKDCELRFVERHWFDLHAILSQE